LKENAERLLVLHGGDQVGWLEKSSAGRMVFAYSKSWLDSPDAFGISLSLPLGREPFKDERPGRFFANLLPEGRLRSLVARRLGLSEDNDFALLEAIGGECAGALSVVPEDRAKSRRPDGYTPLPAEELVEIANSGDVLPYVTGVKQTRLSLAGAQDKLPVLLDEGKLYLPEGNSASSHIIKFPSRDFAYLPANELLTTALARAAGLRVAEMEPLPLGNQLACLVTRYDRSRDGDKLVRIHQEDFCQSLGLGHATKYEDEGGPSFATCYELAVGACNDPLQANEQLLRWHAFNATAGNADGHAKNVSFLLESSRSIRLAPFYDLVCTRAYQRLDSGLAMRVGGVSDPGQIRSEHWTRLAEEIGVGKSFLLELVREVADSVRGALPAVGDDFRSRYGDSPAIQMVSRAVDKQARRILGQLETREGQ